MPFKELTNKPLRAAIYVRVSSERQAAEDRVSVESQLSECEAHCRERGYLVVERYIDKDKYRVKGKLVQPSGSRKDRPAYVELLATAQRGECEVIIAWKEDRLYRGMYAAVPLAEILDELGTRLNVELVRESFDRRMLGIKAALGKIEVENIRERMIMGRSGRLERGEVPGGNQVKYGYRKFNKHLEIEEQEAEIVRKVFDWYIAGESGNEIRRKLNESGRSPRVGKLWSKVTIGKIVTGEFYATGKMMTILDGVTYMIPCPTIISEDTWRQAVAVRQSNKKIPRNIKRDYLCANLVYCACGWKCQGRPSRSNRKRGYEKVSGSYACQKPYREPETCPPECVDSLGSVKVDTAVWNLIRRICCHPQLVQSAIVESMAHQQTSEQTNMAQLSELQKQLENIANERQWVITQARKGRISEEDMEAQLTQLEAQTHETNRQCAELRSQVASHRHTLTLAQRAQKLLTEIQVGLAALETDARTLSKREADVLYEELQAWQFADKFPKDKVAQLNWAILEEKRRIVRTLIQKVVIGKHLGSRERWIESYLTFKMPVTTEVVSNSGDQSAEYIHP